MKKVAIVTATRAEYCFLIPLIRKLYEDNEIDLNLIVTGTHLSAKYGKTIDDINADRFPISHVINILTDGNTAFDISLTMAKALEGFARCFKEDRPDAVILSGDRTEILSIAIAAMNELIPIFHIHGGEVTEGAVDDCIRHALTKMSYLHFTSTEIYRKRVIQLGESPDRVFNVGSLGTENILNIEFMSEEEIRKDIGIPTDISYALVTYHPVTLGRETVEKDARELCEAMVKCDSLFYVITGSNADVGGQTINSIMEEFSLNHTNSIYMKNLGMRRYLSATKYATCIIGNSSSGIMEAPVIGTPTVNIGDRQRGRIMPDTVICAKAVRKDIISAIKEAERMQHKKSDIFGDGNTSRKIVNIMKDFMYSDRIKLKKGFYDLELPNGLE